MLKNKSARSVLILLLLSFLWSCASDNDDEESTWSSTDAIYSAVGISDSKAIVNASGDITLVWSEQESVILDDVALDVAHTFVGTVAAFDSHVNLHTHKILTIKSKIIAKHYDASSQSWGSNKELGEGYLEKIRIGTLDIADTNDDSKIVYEEVIDQLFPRKIAIATNSNGDAFVAWVQLGEGEVVTDGSGNAIKDSDENDRIYSSSDQIIVTSQFNASTQQWSAVNILSTLKTLIETNTIGTGTTTATASATAKAKVENRLAISLNDSNIAQLLWIGTFRKESFQFSAITLNPATNTETSGDITTAISASKEALFTAIDNNSNDTANLYHYTFDNGAPSATFTMISDGTSSVSDVKFVMRNQTSGVALWLQNNTTAQSGAQTQSSLYSNWFNDTAWNSIPVLVNNGLGEVLDFSLASNGGSAIWSGWSQTNSAYPTGVNLTNNDYDVDSISTIWAGSFSGDIDSDLTLGAWTTAVKIQTDIASTAEDESQLPSSEASVAVDVNGNVVVAWVENGDGAANPKFRKDAQIRINRYSVASSAWLAESLLVSDTDYFAAKQLIEKNIPNDHRAPIVVSSAANQFTIGWQYWSTSTKESGFQLYSRDFNASQNTFSQTQSVSNNLSPIVQQSDLISVGGEVQLLWSQETSNGIILNKSNK